MTNEYLYKFRDAKAATRSLQELDESTINKILIAVADSAELNVDKITGANYEDLIRMDSSDPKYDRLMLDKKRVSAIADDIRNVANLKSPIGDILEDRMLDNGLNIKKVVVPFGVIGVIYEARPNVSFDVFSLCFKTGNVCILKGGSDAVKTNEAIVDIIHSVLESFGVNKNVCTLLPAEREATHELLNAVGYVDLIIPRGSQSLINYVRDYSKVPVIETGAGVCHVYFDVEGDITKGAAVVNNAKTRRVSVCNALDCLVIHKDRLGDLKEIVKPLINGSVVILADKPAYEALKGNYPSDFLKEADENSFGTEFMGYKMSVYTADSLDDALNHIEKNSSKHSESIITENKDTKDKFLKLVDAACVYSNASTAFTDGAQFGLGAEIGISTQKLHARGPMALKEITSYKYIIEGDGHVRQ